MNLTVRTRLALWYFAVLMLSFAIFGLIADFGFRHSVEATVHDAVETNLDSIQRVIVTTLPKGMFEVNDELQELSGLWAGGAQVEVADSHGNWIYQPVPFTRTKFQLSQAPDRSFYTLNLDTKQYRIGTRRVDAGDQTFYVAVAVPTEAFDQALDRFRLILKLSSPALIILASLGGYWLSRRAMNPVVEIIQTARNIHGHNLSSRLSVPKPRDELRWLSETLNEMLGRIETSVERTRQFTADASHELRTPIAIIRSCSELALRRARTDAEYRETLRRIQVTSESTTELLENLLQLARADAGADGLDFVPVDLSKCLKQIYEQGSLLGAVKGIRFFRESLENPAWIFGDPIAISRLFLILVDNAVKYTPTGGTVRIACQTADESTRIEIRDSGIGIAEEDLPYIFERFYRADRARSREPGGAGLGLTIARWIVSKHDGTIQVESNVGSGTMFRIELPIYREVSAETGASVIIQNGTQTLVPNLNVSSGSF
jgi:heavy metal sensor kinase